MIPEQQRFWIALLNLQRSWSSDRAALSFIPPAQRDFDSSPNWSQDKALAYLLNNLDLLRDSYARLERGALLDTSLINNILEGLTLQLRTFDNRGEMVAAAQAKSELGGRLEMLQVRSPVQGLNPGTRYIRGTVQRAFYYFAQYADERQSDPAYPGVSQDRWRVVVDPHGMGDLQLQAPARTT